MADINTTRMQSDYVIFTSTKRYSAFYNKTMLNLLD